MSGRCLRSNNRSSYAEEPTECMVNMSVQRFKLGEIIWCRINNGSWWPAQVVDENCVAFKPKRKKKDQILVRLYGTFEHMYVQRTNCLSKAEKISEEGNHSSREIFEKALEEDLSRMKSGCQSEARVSESIENVEEKDEASRGKGQMKGNFKRAMIEENSPRRPGIPEEIDEPSPRRTKIMQSLGLIAPSGSPFRRNGLIQSFSPLSSRPHSPQFDPRP